MVNLASVSTSDEPIIEELKGLKMEETDEHSESIYGSVFASEGLPSGPMPEGEM